MSMEEQPIPDVWRQLPIMLVDQVLSFSTVPDLCRYRTVCKRWNSLICTPEFGNLHAQNANDDTCYIFGRSFHNHFDNRTRKVSISVVGWNIFDLKERRWFTWKGEQDDANVANDHPLASDGGLVVCCSTLAGTTIVSEITIANPVGKTRKVLPYPPFGELWVDSTLVNLVVDSISCTYRIFLINRRQDPYLCVFESTTNQWRSSSNKPVTRTNLRRLEGGAGAQAHSVLFQGLLYVLSTIVQINDELTLREHWPITYWLFTYNSLEDSWKDTGVDFPKWSGNVKIELVVSGDRLFLISGDLLHVKASHGSIRMRDPLTVYEILLADRTLNTVSHLAEPSFDAQGLDVDRITYHFNQALGFGNSIMLTYSGLGFSVVYDLVTSLWNLLPTDPTVEFFGSAVPLTLMSPVQAEFCGI